MLEEIQRYTESVEKGPYVYTSEICPLCGDSPGEKGFPYLCKRPRTFLVVVEALVHKVLSFLVRFRCPSCERSFTDYPSFAVPNKRYVRQEIEERSARYLEDDKATYRRVVREGNTACGYERTDDGEIDDRQLVGSTVHRWITWLGEQTDKLSLVLEMVKALAPRSTIHREPLPLPPCKYRSDKRKKILQIARRLLHAEALVRAIRIRRPKASDFGTEGIGK